MKKLVYLFGIVLATVLTSCGETETKSLSSARVEMTEEYPMEGSNTLTGVWQVDLNGIPEEQIKEARVSSIRFEMISPEKSTPLAGVIMQLAAEGSDMQRIGVLNPVPDDTNAFELSVADQQNNLAELLGQQEITFVADVNLEEELTSSLSMAVSITFDLQTKK